MTFTSFDRQMMNEALMEAQNHIHRVSPNPQVGAILAKDQQIIGRGAHLRYGAAHAEVNAIQNSNGNAKGSTLYVTLEPCSHVGKTPPCTEAIIKAGIKKVVFAMSDPNPLVKIKSSSLILQNAGIEVQIGLLREEALQINQPFIKNIHLQLPYVTLKWAMTLDGKIATKSGDSKWISNGKSRNLVHQLRSQHDAIAVGQGTFENDNPELTCRLDYEVDNPMKVLFLRELMTQHLTSKVFTNLTSHIIVFVKKYKKDRLCQQITDKGIEVIAQPFTLIDTLKLLYQKKVYSVLVEGGAQLNGSFLDQNMVDYVHCFIAPKIVGNSEFTPIKGNGVQKILNAQEIKSSKVEQIDDNVHLHGFLQFYGEVT